MVQYFGTAHPAKQLIFGKHYSPFPYTFHVAGECWEQRASAVEQILPAPDEYTISSISDLNRIADTENTKLKQFANDLKDGVVSLFCLAAIVVASMNGVI